MKQNRIVQNALMQWIDIDLPTLIYMAKATLSGILALFISMGLTLSDPRTAVFTSFIVMQPQSGLVFSKSYYRVLGTLAGVIVSIAMIGTCAQEPILFITLFALWIGFTTAAGVKYRNFQSYGFVLAGYTLCIVALPVIEHPMDIFDVATSRFSEVMIGILCATFVSDIIFPRKLSNSLLASENERFNNILLVLSDAKALFANQEVLATDVAKFSSGVVGLQSIRVNSSFESGADRKNRIFSEQLNQEFMHLSTTYHSLRNIVNTIDRSDAVLDFMQKHYEPVANRLDEVLINGVNENSLSHLITDLKLMKQRVSENFEANKSSFADIHEYETFLALGSLTLRLLNEIYIHCNTYQAYLKLQNSKKVSKELNRVVRFKTYTDNVLVALAALRGSGVLIITMLFWILSSWKYATITVTISVVISLLIGTLPRPLDAVVNFLKGALSAVGLAALFDFYLVPRFATDAYTLAILVAPVFAFVGWMTTKPKWSGFSLGFVFLFMSQSPFDLYYKIDPTTFLETSLASLLGVIFAGVSYMLVNFWSCSLTQKRVAKLLRRQIVSLCSEPLPLQRGSLESMGRDMVQQFSTHGRLNVRSSRLVYEWLLTILELGSAVIKIRKMLKRITDKSEAVALALQLIQKYFEKPNDLNKQRVLSELKSLLGNLQNFTTREYRMIHTEFAIIYMILSSNIATPIKEDEKCL